MKKHLIIRIALLLIGFLLIYCYVHWDSWFHPHPSIGGNSGMSIPMDLVLNVSWMAIWCLLLFIELIVSFFTAKNKENRITNIILIITGIILLVIYILNIK
ncbi:cytochrome c biogenesis factor [Chryseobacterium ginsenosidimutans]|nr:cytochrome c biogenesis factor [Chryseobacterium ginsenosidimutans]